MSGTFREGQGWSHWDFSEEDTWSPWTKKVGFPKASEPFLRFRFIRYMKQLCQRLG